MLTIRAAQMTAFRGYLKRQLEERIRTHLLEAAPQDCARQSDAELRTTIRRGLERCEHFGFHEEYDIFCYLNLMFTLGPDFDKDPRYPWAAAILAGEQPARARMDLLMDHAFAALEES